MDAIGMKYEFLLTYESIASGAAPGYTNRDISAFLTESQEDIVKELCADGIDKNDLNRIVLNSLKSTSQFDLNENASLVTYPIRAYSIDLGTLFITPNRFFFPYIENIFKSGITIEVHPVGLDELVNLKNPFKKPSLTKYWRILSGNKMLIVPPTNVNFRTGDKINITYIKKPSPIIVGTLQPNQAIDSITTITDCTLNDIIHRDIVYRAAKKAYAATQNATGYQIQANEENS